MRHERVTEGELQDWILAEVRRRPDSHGFTAKLTFVRFHFPASSGATWAVDATTDRETWSHPFRDAFDVAIRQAQRVFDLVD